MKASLLWGFVFFVFSPSAFGEGRIDALVEKWREVVVKRLNLAINVRNLTEDINDSRLADEIGISRGLISKIRSGQNTIGIDVGRELARVLKVKTEWLLAFDIIRRDFGSLEELQAIEKPSVRRVVKFAFSEQFPHVNLPFLENLKCDDLLQIIPTEDLIRELKRRN